MGGLEVLLLCMEGIHVRTESPNASGTISLEGAEVIAEQREVNRNLFTLKCGDDGVAEVGNSIVLHITVGGEGLGHSKDLTVEGGCLRLNSGDDTRQVFNPVAEVLDIGGMLGAPLVYGLLDVDTVSFHSVTNGVDSGITRPVGREDGSNAGIQRHAGRAQSKAGSTQVSTVQTSWSAKL